MRVIAGTARSIQLLTPEGELTRPTIERVKEAVFSSIQFDLPGMRVLDLFAGTGQMGIEALSRGAKHATFVDCRQDALKIVQENLRRTKLQDRAEIIHADYEAYLRNCRDQFDLILLDPPYAEKFLENALKSISEIDILSNSGIIIAEYPADKHLADVYPCIVMKKSHRYGKVCIAQFRRYDNI